MFFFLKKLVATLAMPLPLALLLTLLGGVLLLLRRRRTGRVLLAASVLGIFLAAWGPVADALLTPLEKRWPPVLDASVHKEAAAVVVLGSGYQPNSSLPITSQLGDSALHRLTEGVRLYRQLPGVSLVLSGGSVFGSGAAAHGYQKAALALGVPAGDLVLIDTPQDTAEEARAVRELLGKRSFILVTSASHMPRAMRYFRKAGLNPIPAPTRHRSLREDRSNTRYWSPSAAHLQKTERAIYEYLGSLAVYFVKEERP